MVYLGRSRLHRSRANLIQTLHTIAALQEHGPRVRLYLPPWPRRLNVERVLQDMGVDGVLDLRRSMSLHPRFRFHPFVWLHRRRLRRATTLYTRVPQISLALAAAGLVNHLEVHDTRKLVDEGLLPRLVRHHRAGRVGMLFPISRSAADTLIEAGAVADRVCVLPSGVDLGAYADVTPFDGSQLDEPRIVYLGRLSEMRGLKVLEAISQRVRAHLTLVGDQDDEVAAIPGIQVHPFVPPRQVPDWYAKCDLVLLPYQPGLEHIESISPLKLFEAMAAGRPILISDLPPMREVIEHEKTGLLIDPCDVDAWVDAVERLRRDRALACRLAQAAKEQAVRYGWSARAATILRTIR